MIPGVVLVAAQFLQLTAPDNQQIRINPAEVVTMRPPRRTDHFAPGAKCLIFTGDGKMVSVVETCEEVVTKQLK